MAETGSYPAIDAVFSFVTLEIFVRILIVLAELPYDVLTDITVGFLDLASHPKLVFWGNVCHLATFTHEVENELRDVASGNRDMLDSATNDIAFSAGDNVSDTISRVDDGSSEGTVGDFVGRP